MYVHVSGREMSECVQGAWKFKALDTLELES